MALLAVIATVAVAVAGVAWLAAPEARVFDWIADGRPPLRQPTVAQGVYGHVVLWEGNCMPAMNPRACRASFVSREVTVRELTAASAMDGTHLREGTGLVATARSGTDGFFEVSLPDGAYSLFVEDEGREYCNRFDGRGNVCPVTVSGDVVRFDLEINHASW